MITSMATNMLNSHAIYQAETSLYIHKNVKKKNVSTVVFIFHDKHSRTKANRMLLLIKNQDNKHKLSKIWASCNYFNRPTKEVHLRVRVGQREIPICCRLVSTTFTRTYFRQAGHPSTSPVTTQMFPAGKLLVHWWVLVWTVCLCEFMGSPALPLCQPYFQTEVLYLVVFLQQLSFLHFQEVSLGRVSVMVNLKQN